MRVIAILFASLLCLPAVSAAQEWEEFVSVQDGFAVNFPGKPKVTDIKWQSQLRYELPARVYTAEKGAEKFSLTAVDFSGLEQLGVARWKQCPPGNAQCRDGGVSIGPGYWKQDERGAMTYAIAKYLKGPYKVTDYTWDWQDMVEGEQLQLDSADGQRRVLVFVAMHQRKLYILEASAPHHHPEPGLFQQSMGYVNENGKRIRYTETIYSNSYHGLGVYPRPEFRVAQ